MSAFLLSVVLGALFGYADARFSRGTSLMLPFVFGIALGKVMHYFVPPGVVAIIGIYLAGSIAYVIVLLFFSDDDRWRRFKKKTSQALEKLLAKVKELAPTPASKPLPA